MDEFIKLELEMKKNDKLKVQKMDKKNALEKCLYENT